MCLFPYSVTRKQLLERPTDVLFARPTTFNCGYCPECLRQRASVWVVRSYYESLAHEHNCMITLTYDNYARDSFGRIVGELPPDRDLLVCKRDVQLFLKRLRKHYSSVPIKYIAAAEYGSRTHRAHYHILLFGVDFSEDRVPYKKSTRGNFIYTSSILTKLWGHGICTVDNVNLNAASARYCTKYTAKSRSSGTFMLFSHSLGLKGMLEHFNGRSYFIEGREYPIPRSVWQQYIMTHYSELCPDMDYRYVNFDFSRLSPVFSYTFDGQLQVSYNDPLYLKSRLSRSLYRAVRNASPEYTNYLMYWRSLAQENERLRPDPMTRLNLLPDSQFYAYKQAARPALSAALKGLPHFVPGKPIQRRFFKDLASSFIQLGLSYDPAFLAPERIVEHSSVTFPLRRLSIRYPSLLSIGLRSCLSLTSPLVTSQFTASEVPSDSFVECVYPGLPYISCLYTANDTNTPFDTLCTSLSVSSGEQLSFFSLDSF